MKRAAKFYLNKNKDTYLVYDLGKLYYKAERNERWDKVKTYYRYSDDRYVGTVIEKDENECGYSIAGFVEEERANERYFD